MRKLKQILRSFAQGHAWSINLVFELWFSDSRPHILITKPVVLTLHCASESPRGLVKSQIAGPYLSAGEDHPGRSGLGPKYLHF